jgi:DNA-binding PucR family transcriptional regulator
VARDTLGPLLGDRDSARNLLGTLAAFVDEAHSVRGAATALHLHENTIRYRLSRIEELTGLQMFTQAADQLSAQLAVTALRLRGTLAPAGDSAHAAAVEERAV